MQRALGLAISRWARIESALSIVFWKSVTARRSDAASAAFSAIRSAEAQIDMVDATVRTTFRFAPAVLAEWKPLHRRLKNVRPLRNRLAHGPIVRRKTGNEPTITRFVPFYHLDHHISLEGFDQWTVEKLRDCADQFADVATAVRQFGLNLDAWNAPLTKPHEQDHEPDQTQAATSEKTPQSRPSGSRTPRARRAPRPPSAE